MNPLISNLLMQPKLTDAVERPMTLIEELEDLRDRFRSSYEEMGDHDELVISDTFDKAIAIVKQHSQETCDWRNNKGTGLWECHYGGDYTSDCGLEWNMSNKDSPRENEMHFCPKCGKKLVEVQPPSAVQDD